MPAKTASWRITCSRYSSRLLKKSEASLFVETKARYYVSDAMRGPDTQQSSMFSYLSPEERVPARHPLRPIRLLVDDFGAHEKLPTCAPIE